MGYRPWAFQEPCRTEFRLEHLKGIADVRERHPRKMKYTAPIRHSPAHKKFSVTGCFM